MGSDSSGSVGEAIVKVTISLIVGAVALGALGAISRASRQQTVDSENDDESWTDDNEGPYNQFLPEYEDLDDD
jgi:hypothetical protein